MQARRALQDAAHSNRLSHWVVRQPGSSFVTYAEEMKGGCRHLPGIAEQYRECMGRTHNPGRQGTSLGLTCQIPTTPAPVSHLEKRDSRRVRSCSYRSLLSPLAHLVAPTA